MVPIRGVQSGNGYHVRCVRYAANSRHDKDLEHATGAWKLQLPDRHWRPCNPKRLHSRLSPPSTPLGRIGPAWTLWNPLPSYGSAVTAETGGASSITGPGPSLWLRDVERAAACLRRQCHWPSFVEAIAPSTVVFARVPTRLSGLRIRSPQRRPQRGSRQNVTLSIMTYALPCSVRKSLFFFFTPRLYPSMLPRLLVGFS